MSTAPPPNFPSGIPISQQTFENWSQAIKVANLWTCVPASAADVVTVCNWAKGQGYQVRARGIMHTWSPITVTQDQQTVDPKVVLVDTTKSLTGMTLVPASGGQPARVKVGTGATMLALLEFLEGNVAPPGGFAFPHTPAPGNLTVGGVLAIDAHGTAIPTPPNDDFDASYGSLSNQILEFTAVVTDPKSPTSGYALRTFTRGEGDDKAFLTHVGRAFLVDATLQLVPNYNLRCQSTMPDATTLFQAPSPTTPIPANSLASYLQASGRVEAIWFPFSTKPWLKVWTVSPTQPSGSRSVSQPYNYIFSDQLPSWIVDMIKLIKYVPSMTPTFGQAMETVTSAGLGFTNTTDIWGPSKNTLLYVRDTTVTYTANGYAVQMKLSDVQQSVADFTAKFQSMLTEYDSQSKWPVNGPLEIRVTALDQTTKVGVPPGKTATTPVISALSYDSVAAQNQWDVALWFDVLTLPGTQYSDQFYQELEAWMASRFTGASGRPMAEWSKGWAYTDQGAWTDAAYLSALRQFFTTGRPANDDWNYEVQTLKAYDAFNLFSNPFLEILFTAVSP